MVSRLDDSILYTSTTPPNCSFDFELDFFSLVTDYDPYFLPSVNMMPNWIVLATWDKFETHLLCNARVTILVRFGEPHGCPPYPPHEWF